MVSQNTVARNDLTDTDKKALDICGKVSKILEESLATGSRETFRMEYGKVHYSRDAGQGRAAGKLQRDAVCTRGKQAKAPFSNRNLRWHPLVLANKCPPGFAEVDLEIDRRKKMLVFVSKSEGRNYVPSNVHTLAKPCCVTRDSWIPHLDELKNWTMDDWIPNWCTIPAIEYCPWEYAVESYATLGIAITVGLFGADLDKVYAQTRSLLRSEFSLSKFFPPLTREIVQCPLCKSPINEYPAGLQKRERPKIWKPEWTKVKREEGEDESIQLMHMNPLVETEISHNASNVRYSHRWCNVAMTDHSIGQTIEWMGQVVRRHT